MKANDALNGDTLIERNEELLMAEVDGELLAMSVEQGACYGLNRVGTRIWTLLASPCSIDGLCAKLLDEFEVDEATCRREVCDLIDSLRAEGLVTLRPN